MPHDSILDGTGYVSLKASEIRVSLGQYNLDYHWGVPDDVTGSTMTRHKVIDGDRLDPPAVSVTVFEGMRFRDSSGDWWVFDGAYHKAYRDEFGAEPNPEIRLRADSDTEEQTREERTMSTETFAELIKDKALIPQSGVSNYNDRGIL